MRFSVLLFGCLLVLCLLLVESEAGVKGRRQNKGVAGKTGKRQGRKQVVGNKRQQVGKNKRMTGDQGEEAVVDQVGEEEELLVMMR